MSTYFLPEMSGSYRENPLLAPVYIEVSSSSSDNPTVFIDDPITFCDEYYENDEDGRLDVCVYRALGGGNSYAGLVCLFVYRADGSWLATVTLYVKDTDASGLVRLVDEFQPQPL